MDTIVNTVLLPSDGTGRVGFSAFTWRGLYFASHVNRMEAFFSLNGARDLLV